MTAIADTSGMFAAFDTSTQGHAAAAKIMSTERLIISPLVLTELDHLARHRLSFHASTQITDALHERIRAGQYRYADVSFSDLTQARSLQKQYTDLQLDLADAVNVVLAEKHRTRRVLTLDERDFRAITPLTRAFTAFEILPADL